MLIIPAIDLKKGRCVRLWQGIKSKETIYAEDPLQVARLWTKMGAKRLHIVDLDGAFTGTPKHLSLVENIKNSLSACIQYGGGIRNLKIMEEVIQKNIDFVIIGTKALSENFVRNAVDRFGEKIIASIDCKDNKVAIRGWEAKASIDIQKLGENLTREGIKTIILTDIARDGTLQGVNIEFIQKFIKNIDCNLIIAGGISSIEDIKRIKQLENERIEGVIVGKALYAKTVKLKEALKIANKG